MGYIIRSEFNIKWIRYPKFITNLNIKQAKWIDMFKI